MGEFYTEKSWLPIVAAQEAALQFDKFDYDDAINIGQKLIAKAREKQTKPIAVSVEIDNMEVFLSMMPGTNAENRDWMRRKVNSGKRSGISSLHLCLQVAYGVQNPDWLQRKESYVACGGCWPVRVKGQDPFAYILVSGLPHQMDHQIIVDVLSEYLGVETGSIE